MYTKNCAIVHLQFGDNNTLFKGKFRCDLEPGLKKMSPGGELGWQLFPHLSQLGTYSGEIKGAPKVPPSPHI